MVSRVRILMYYIAMVIMIEELRSRTYVQVALNLARRIHFTPLFFKQPCLLVAGLSCMLLANSIR